MAQNFAWSKATHIRIFAQPCDLNCSNHHVPEKTVSGHFWTNHSGHARPYNSRIFNHNWITENRILRPCGIKKWRSGLRILHDQRQHTLGFLLSLVIWTVQIMVSLKSRCQKDGIGHFSTNHSGHARPCNSRIFNHNWSAKNGILRPCGMKKVVSAENFALSKATHIRKFCSALWFELV